MRTFTDEEVEILLNSRMCEKPKTNAGRIRSMSDDELAGSRVDRIDFYTNLICRNTLEILME